MASTVAAPTSTAGPAPEPPVLPSAAPSARRRRDVPIACWQPLTAAVVVLGGLAFSLALQFAVIAVAGGEDGPHTIHAGALMLAEIPLLLLVLWAARRQADGLTPATFGIRRTRFWSALGWTLVVYFGVAMCEGLYVAIVGAPGGSSGGGGIPASETGNAVMVVIGVAVLAPLIEEIAFRGYLFPALSRWRGPWLAAVVTAVLFAAAHLAAYPPVLVPLLFFFGFGACLLYWFTGSLLPSMGLHALNNGIVVAALATDAGPGLVAGALCAPIVVVLLMLPFARERAPQAV
jgi:membrane protease YdiL (CAAX protease family)